MKYMAASTSVSPSNNIHIPPTVGPVLGNVQVPVYQVIDETVTTNLAVYTKRATIRANSSRPKNIALLQGWT
jgi:hypothetical protein